MKKIHNEELDNLHPSPNIIRTIKSKTMTSASNVVWMGQNRSTTKFVYGALNVDNDGYIKINNKEIWWECAD
jgi:hypothetical protein